MPAVRNKRVRNKRVSDKRVVILNQLLNGIMTISEGAPHDQEFPIEDCLVTTRNNAEIAGIRNGPRFEKCCLDRLATCSTGPGGLIDADFAKGTYKVTEELHTVFGRVRKEEGNSHKDEKARQLARLRAIKQHVGPLKGLTKPEIIALNAGLVDENREIRAHADRLQRQVDLLPAEARRAPTLIGPFNPELPARVVQHRYLSTAGPSNAERPFVPVTPLRKSASMGVQVYPSPESLPPRRRPHLGVIPASPPSSPSPMARGSSAMDVDDDELLLGPPASSSVSRNDSEMDLFPVEPRPTPEELQTALAQVKAELGEKTVEVSHLEAKLFTSEQVNRQLVNELAQCRSEVLDYQVQIADLEVQQQQLQDRNDARVQELQDEQDVLRALQEHTDEEITTFQDWIRAMEVQQGELEEERDKLAEENTAWQQKDAKSRRQWERMQRNIADTGYPYAEE